MQGTRPTAVPTVGTVAPDFRLASARGPDVALSDYRGKRNLVLWFSKGLVCPFCRRHMAQLRLGYSEIQQRGGEVLHVSLSTPEEARLYFRQQPLGFPYLCDAERLVHERYGIHAVRPPAGEAVWNFVAASVLSTSDQLRGEKPPSPAPYWKRNGFPLFRDSGQALFIVDRDGVIRHVHTAGSAGGIPSNADLLKHLAALG